MMIIIMGIQAVFFKLHNTVSKKVSMKKLIISLLILAGYINLQAQLKCNDLIKENLSGKDKFGQ
jgi:hypothetical protein